MTFGEGGLQLLELLLGERSPVSSAGGGGARPRGVPARRIHAATATHWRGWIHTLCFDLFEGPFLNKEKKQIWFFLFCFQEEFHKFKNVTDFISFGLHLYTSLSDNKRCLVVLIFTWRFQEILNKYYNFICLDIERLARTSGVPVFFISSFASWLQITYCSWIFIKFQNKISTRHEKILCTYILVADKISPIIVTGFSTLRCKVERLASHPKWK